MYGRIEITSSIYAALAATGNGTAGTSDQSVCRLAFLVPSSRLLRFFADKKKQCRADLQHERLEE